MTAPASQRQTIFVELGRLDVGQRLRFSAQVVAAAFPDHPYFDPRSAEDQFRDLLVNAPVGAWELDVVDAEGGPALEHRYEVERIA